MSFLKISLRNIPRRKLRSGLTAMAVVLSIALLVGVNISMDSAMEAFKLYIGRTWGETDIIITYGRGEFGEENLSLVRGVEGVDKALARLYRAAFIDGDRGKIVGAAGVDPEIDYEYKGYRDLISGDWDISGNNIVVTPSLCDNYRVGIGDVLTVTFEWSLEENGIPCNLKIIGIYEPTEIVEFPNFFFIELGYLQNITGRKGEINSINAKVIDVEKTGEIKDNLKNLFGPEFTVRTPKLDAIERIKGMTEGFERGLHGMTIVSLIVCAFLVFNTMFITVRERTHEIGILRSSGASGFQIFRMFLSESLVLGLVGISLGMVGGLLLSKFFIWLFSVSFRVGYLEETPLILTPSIIQMGILAGMITVLAGALYPAISACRITVDQALRPGMRFGRRAVPMWVYFAVGLILSAFGLSCQIGVIPRVEIIDTFTLLVGVIICTGAVLPKVSTAVSKYQARVSRGVGMLVSKNVGRKILRNTVCFGIIGICLSFIIMTGGIKYGVVEAMEEGVRESFGFDIILRSPAINLPTAFTENLKGIEGVKAVTPMSIAPRGTICLKPVSKSIGVMVIDPRTHSDVIRYEFLEPSPEEAYEKLAQSTEALILPRVLADELGVQVGDNLTLITEKITIGRQVVSENTDFTVVGIFLGAVLHHIRLPGGYLMSESVVISFDSQTKHFYPPWGENRAWVFLVAVEPGTDSEEVLQAIENAFPLYGFAKGSLTLNRILDWIRKDIDRVFFILFSVLYFSVLISVMAVAIVMIMNVIERKQEIGIMRSQGISGRQTLSMFLWEAIVLGIIGFAIGLPCGTIILKGVTRTMLAAGLSVPMIMPWDTIVHALILSIIVAIAGGLYPARRASKITVVEALQRR